MPKRTDHGTAPAKPPKPPAAGPREIRTSKCVVCGADAAPISQESLCWVCRRLKVSAWSEGADSQMFAPE